MNYQNSAKRSPPKNTHNVSEHTKEEKINLNYANCLDTGLFQVIKNLSPCHDCAYYSMISGFTALVTEFQSLRTDQRQMIDGHGRLFQMEPRLCMKSILPLAGFALKPLA